MLPNQTFTDHLLRPASESPRTLSERAYLAVRQDIVQGRLAPGERLRVEHLKDRYAVGAGTLREALALLVSDALVTVEGQRGYRVAEISLGDLKDLTDTRVMLETEALRQSIRLGDARWESDLAQAFAALTEAEQQPGGLEPLAWEMANKRFHEALISACSSAWTQRFLSILYLQMERYRRLTAMHNQPARNVHEEHLALRDSVLARDVERCTQLLRAHIESSILVVRQFGLLR